MFASATFSERAAETEVETWLDDLAEENKVVQFSMIHIPDWPGHGKVFVVAQLQHRPVLMEELTHVKELRFVEVDPGRTDGPMPEGPTTTCDGDDVDIDAIKMARDSLAVYLTQPGPLREMLEDCGML